MSRLQWDDSLETGFEAVDDQHRTLMALFNEFEDGLRKGYDRHDVGDLLVNLCDYVATHFADEEALMQRFEYAEDLAAAHREEHRRLAERTRELALAHRAGADSASELASLLRGWLVDHIMRIDCRLVSHIQMVIAAQG